MISSILGKKIGMTQIFSEDGKVVPVTIVDFKDLFVTQVKTVKKDGYCALQVGLLRDRYYNVPFDVSWCKNKKKYFLQLTEFTVDADTVEKAKIGKAIRLEDVQLDVDMPVQVSGKSTGLGFQGVVKRWGFGGGPSSHGSNFHRIPGSIGNICSQGKVVKGKKMPGRCGGKKVSVSGLKIARLDKKDGYVFVKGAVPGKKGSLIIVSKQG